MLRKIDFRLGCLTLFLMLGLLTTAVFMPTPRISPLRATTQPADVRAIASDSIRILLAQRKIPGLAVAVVIGDSLVWQEGFGLADVENNTLVKPESVFRIASISKTITAVAVMQLVEKGLIRLDDEIQKYVPSFPQKRWPVTVRHLLTHTAGIRHYKAGEFEMKDAFDSIAEAIKIFKDDTLLFQPGTKYSYTTYGFNLLAGVVEAASGMRFESYLQKNIWGPAGMHHTYFEHQRAIVPHRVRQYVLVGDSLTNAPFADLSIKWAGGGMIATVGDLARFHIALNRGILLKKSTLAMMSTPFTLADGKRTSYGLGWVNWTRDSGSHWIGHSGGATGGTTMFIRRPEKGVAVIIFANSQSAPIGPLAWRIAAIFGYR